MYRRESERVVLYFLLGCIPKLLTTAPFLPSFAPTCLLQGNNLQETREGREEKRGEKESRGKLQHLMCFSFIDEMLIDDDNMQVPSIEIPQYGKQ